MDKQKRWMFFIFAAGLFTRTIPISPMSWCLYMEFACQAYCGSPRTNCIPRCEPSSLARRQFISLLLYTMPWVANIYCDCDSLDCNQLVSLLLTALGLRWYRSDSDTRSACFIYNSATSVPVSFMICHHCRCVVFTNAYCVSWIERCNGLLHFSPYSSFFFVLIDLCQDFDRKDHHLGCRTLRHNRQR